MSGAPVHPVDVLLVLYAGEQLLLALREGTGYADGMWNLPSGKLKIDEHAISGLVREAREEVGVRLEPGEVELAATIHHRNTARLGRIGLVFAVEFDRWRHGEPTNMEPHKCARIDWFPI